MDLSVLINSFLGLIALLAILFIFLFYSPSKKQASPKKKSQSQSSAKKELTFDELRAVIRDRSSSKKELQDAIDQILKKHGKIHPKMGIRVHPDFDIYMTIILNLCRHPQVDSKMILQFDKELAQKNPDYKKEISGSTTKGVNSRGA